MVTMGPRHYLFMQKACFKAGPVAFSKHIKGIWKIWAAMLSSLNRIMQSLEMLSVLEWHPGKLFRIVLFLVLRITSLTTENKKKTLPNFESNYLKRI